MRMWMVDPRKMCRKHLLGEHVECHMYLGAVRALRSLDGFFQARYLFKPSCLKARHDALAAEMMYRGYLHHTPFTEDDTQLLLKSECFYDSAPTACEADSAANVTLLAMRCVECRNLQ